MIFRQASRYEPTRTGAAADAAAANVFPLVAGSALIGLLFFSFGQDLMRLAELLQRF